MNTKEKLEMIWKYLALILIAILGFTWIENNHFIGGPKKGEFVFIGDENYDFHGNELKKMNVDVQKEVVNGDTTMRVTVNGKPMDVSEFKEMNGNLKWTSEDGEIHIMKMRHDDEYELHEEDEHENGNKKIIRKKIMKKKVSS
ncbi:MAG: hypothetical protein OXU46_00905 [Candidatus Marinimicrobia bacterium]|nr:hypothetical protein [Candidatus Neomarinimicrobiota bacterium]